MVGVFIAGLNRRTFVPSIRTKRKLLCISLCALTLLIPAIAPLDLIHAQGVTGSIKGTVSATAGDSAARSAVLPGARLSLVNRDIPGAAVKTVTDETGSFAFLNLPAANYTITAEADGLPSVTREIRLTTGAALVVEIVLTATVTASVTVRDEEGLLSTSETTTSNTVRAETLEDLPLQAENYQSALPLTPGVVRGMDGADHIKGARAGQNGYTVNGVDVTDPVTGNLSFDIPIEAAASVQIEENPYSAEYGRFTGGTTNLETKTGGDKFKVTADRVFPVLRNIIGGQVDSFRPRLTFSGPLLGKRLKFLQSFEYRFSRVRVPSLTAPHDDSTSEAFNSFTQLDLNINKHNTLKFVGAVSPQKMRYVGLDTFSPQGTTPNTKQQSETFSVSEQAIFNDDSFLSSLLSYKRSQFHVFAQGPQALTVLPDGREGNYFADTRRSFERWQWQQTYFARPMTFYGQHSIKLGAEYDHTNMIGAFTFQSILIRRSDQTLSERIDFTGPGFVSRSLDELGAFVQDRWVINKRLTVDAGLRFDHDTLALQKHVAPRVSFMYLPLKDDRTIIRGGIGVFYDRSPLSSGYFDLVNPDTDDDALADAHAAALASPTRFPGRIVTTYAPDGVTVIDGPRTYMNVAKGPLRDARSARWSFQVDRGLTRHLTARLGYLQRSTVAEPIVIPQADSTGAGMLILESQGRSQYRELQALLVYNSQRFHNWNISYVWSRAQGDLNTADNFLTDFPALVVRPNQYGPLPFDAPHRLLAYGEIKGPYEITVSPMVEIHSGFPFSIVNDRLEFIGARNQAGRFPIFFSVDAQVMKGFKVPFLDKKARAGVAILNITNHFNPRDLQNNTGSLQFGQFFNSLGTSIRGKFELDF
jgi:hypothetical protein